MQLIQIDVLIDLLNKTNIGAIGLLLAAHGLLIWYILKQEKRYNKLLEAHHNEQEANKKILIEIATKSISATEKNTQVILTIKELINAKS